MSDAPTEGARDRSRRRLTWSIGLAVAGLVLIVGTVALLVVLQPDSGSGARPDAPASGSDAGLVLSVAGLLLTVVGAVQMWRHSRRLGGWFNPLLALRGQERRELMAQIRGRRPVDPARLPLARNVAERVIVQRWLILMVAGPWLNLLGQWIARPTTTGVVLVVVAMVLCVGAATWNEWEVHRARRFLAEHPSPG